MVTSRSILLRMRNHNTHFTFNKFFQNIVPFMRLLLLLLVVVVVVVVVVFSPWARNQSPVRRLVWLWYAASWASS